VGYVVDKLAVGQDFLRVLLFFSVSIIPSIIHAHISFILATDSVIKLYFTSNQEVCLSQSFYVTRTNVRDPRVVSTDLGQSFLAPFVRLPQRLINTPTTSSQLVILLTSGRSSILSTQCQCGTLMPHLVTQIWLSLDSTSKLAKTELAHFHCNLNALVIFYKLQFLEAIEITGVWKQSFQENIWTNWGCNKCKYNILYKLNHTNAEYISCFWALIVLRPGLLQQCSVADQARMILEQSPTIQDYCSD
jgi:hypothetical protein